MYTVIFKDKITKKTTRKISGWLTIDSAKWNERNTKENEYMIITEHGKKV